MEEHGVVEKSEKTQYVIGEVPLTEKNDRITIRVDAYWENALEEPVQSKVVVNKLLDSHGIEPFVRKMLVTEECKSLFLGDIERDKVGYLILTNSEGTKLLQTPTQEEAEDIRKRIVLFNGFEIHPYGMTFLGQPSTTEPLIVKCLHGQAVLQVCIFPR